MARNRRNESAARWLKPTIYALLFCGLFAAAGVGYVWYKDQITVLGRQLKERESKLAGLERTNKMRRDHYAELCSPVMLDARVKKLNLNLAPAALTQVVRLVDAPPENQAATAARAPGYSRQAQAGTLVRGN